MQARFVAAEFHCKPWTHVAACTHGHMAANCTGHRTRAASSPFLSVSSLTHAAICMLLLQVALDNAAAAAAACGCMVLVNIAADGDDGKCGC